MSGKLEDALNEQFDAVSHVNELRRKNYPSTLNDRLVVRSNDELKKAFEELCKASGHKPSNAVRLMMLKSIRDWRLNV
ncbi:hypothetical protein F0224_04930 [Vibrio coralliilyticus]|uniref:hypothetical protein n=1 Tax=Vibrio coralliilyticus TaxID=190893 RepID=UPI000BAC2348|nr:hypothetical protein [Vibrio coralliilyticus]NOI75014.1 hypothetical protein [Vibrio coralliilyticus]PAW05592.1 hypothetical protein CKJ79_04935 [Vibrio coralliilyticus]